MRDGFGQVGKSRSIPHSCALGDAKCSFLRLIDSETKCKGKRLLIAHKGDDATDSRNKDVATNPKMLLPSASPLKYSVFSTTRCPYN